MKDIKQLLKTFGISAPQDPSIFFDNAYQAYPKESAKFEKLIDKGSTRTLTRKKFELKNSSLGFSDLISSQFDSDRILKAIEHIVKIDWIKPRETILDIGCDAGIMTCALATLFPESSFVGIDNNPKAIQLSIKRAKQLGLNNVIFENRDIGKSKTTTPKFDKAIASVVFSHVNDKIWLNLPANMFSHEEIFHWCAEHAAAKEYQDISMAIKDGGEFMLIERAPEQVSYSCPVTIGAIAKSGLYLVGSSKIWAIDIGGRQSNEYCDEGRPFEVSIFNKCQSIDKPVTVETVIPPEEKRYRDLEKPTHFLRATFRWKNGSGTQISELGMATINGQNRLYSYTTTNQGMRNFKSASISGESWQEILTSQYQEALSHIAHVYVEALEFFNDGENRFPTNEDYQNLVNLLNAEHSLEKV